MKSGVTLAFALVAVLLLGTVGSAHHPISAKFDDTQAADVERRRDARRLEKSARPHLHQRAQQQRRRQLGDRAREPDRSAGQWLDARLGEAGRRDHGRRHHGA